MNKFLVFPCVKKNEDDGYTGPLVTLVNDSNISFALFFPISEENADTINYILETPPEKHSLNDGGVIGMCQTMIGSWGSGNRYLSGIHMDSEYDKETDQDIITVRLMLSDEYGEIDSVLRVNFVHAIILASMMRREIMVTNNLLDKLIPKNEENTGEENEDEDEDENENNNDNDNGDNRDDSDDDKPDNKPNKPNISKEKFPIDKEILDIAKKIMTGKIK